MTRWLDDGDVRLFHGDALDVLAELPDASVHMCATSPPFYGLRDYGTGEWEGGGEGCDHLAPPQGGPTTGPLAGTGHRERGKDVSYGATCGRCGARRVDRQIGLEDTPDEWVARLVAVFREVRRVLRDDGTLWVEIGDSYTSGNRDGHGTRIGAKQGTNRASALGLDDNRPPTPDGLKPKDLLGQPWLLAFALRADGWYLRSEIIWSRPNPMPESVTDRPTKAHSTMFLLSKRPRYFFDADAIREAYQEAQGGRAHRRYPEGFKEDASGNGRSGRMQGPTRGQIAPPQSETLDGSDGEAPRGPDGRRATAVKGQENSEQHRDGERWPNPSGANARSVWTIATEPTPYAHFACVDEATEALTPDGWRSHEDLSDGDMIAIYDPLTDACSFERAQFTRYPYDGELVAIDKRDSSQRLTPNHRCYVRKRNGELAIVEAADLRADMDTLTCAPLHRIWSGEAIGASLAALVGWYIAEGSERSAHRVTIYQSDSANPQHVETIRRLLTETGAEFRESQRERVGQTFASRTVEVAFSVGGTVGQFLRDHGKRVTDEDLARPDDETHALLDALIDGDGHRRKDGRACIIQKDRDAIDRMQMLALRCGYRANVSRRSDGGHVLYLTDGRWLTLRGTGGTLASPGREHYDGIVWCPSVRTGLWLARREGKPFITGNTWPRKLVSRMILAGTSERGCCPECGAPWVRDVDVAYEKSDGGTTGKRRDIREPEGRTNGTGQGGKQGLNKIVTTLGWSPSCDHNHEPIPCTILDPFAGSGTTCLVARNHGRHSIGIELNADYLAIASDRLSQQSLLTGDAA